MKATEQYFSCGAVSYVAQGGWNFWVCGWNSFSFTIQFREKVAGSISWRVLKTWLRNKAYLTGPQIILLIHRQNF